MKKQKEKKLIQEIIKAGNTYFVRTFPARNTCGKKTQRSVRKNTTTKAVARSNEHSSERKLMMLINHNFNDGDLHAILTYKGAAPEPTDARREFENFLRRLRTDARKQGYKLKYIYVTEYEGRRIHHHIILSGNVRASGLRRIWKCGNVIPQYLYTGGNYIKLARYLVKETKGSIRNAGAVWKQRYGCSRTIARPQVKRMEVSTDEYENPSTPAGYTIDEDSYWEGDNPVTGLSYKEYIMVPSEPFAEWKKWKRLKRARPRPDGTASWLRNNAEYQFEMNP